MIHLTAGMGTKAYLHSVTKTKHAMHDGLRTLQSSEPLSTNAWLMPPRQERTTKRPFCSWLPTYF